MRYPREKIKEAILHPDLAIRDRAVHYFSDAFTPDPSIMPLVIQAVETFGRQNDTYPLIRKARRLAQTEATIAWIIDELNADQTATFEHYANSLSMILVDADVGLVAARESDILGACHFSPELRERFTERLSMRSWDEAECWRRLEEFCEANKDEQCSSSINMSYAFRVVETLARFWPACEPKAQELLSVTVHDRSRDAMGWMEPLVVRLAGLVRCEATVPVIVGKLLEDGGDVLNEQCAEALTRIGTPSVLHAIADAYSTAIPSFRIFATMPLDRIHSDLAVEIAVRFFNEERDEYARCALARSLLCQFASEAIDVVRQVVRVTLPRRMLNLVEKDLRHFLIETCTLTGDRFPEFDAWIASEKSEHEEHLKRLKSLADDPAGVFQYAFERLLGKPVGPPAKPRAPLTRDPRLAQPRAAAKPKPGRNDPCPCGSGRKHKACCLRR